MAAIGVSLTLGTYHLATVRERREVHDEFQRQASRIANLIEYAMSDCVESLCALRGLIYGSDSVSREEFTRFVDEAFSGRVGVHTYIWRRVLIRSD